MSTSKMAIPQGWQLLPIVETIPSTNTWLKEHAEHLQDKTILIAREQTQGRGRSDRSFHSARDRGLYLSVLLKETISDLPLTKLTALCALATHRAIKESCQLTTQIKWVNDILCQEYNWPGSCVRPCMKGHVPRPLSSVLASMYSHRSFRPWTISRERSQISRPSRLR